MSTEETVPLQEERYFMAVGHQPIKEGDQPLPLSLLLGTTWRGTVSLSPY